MNDSMKVYVYNQAKTSILFFSPVGPPCDVRLFSINMHELCDLFLRNEIMSYVCVLLFSFQTNMAYQHVLLWNVMKIRAFLQLLFPR